MNAIVNQKKLAEDFGISLSTVRERVKEMREQQGKRYRAPVVFDDGNIVLVNVFAFADWLKWRGMIKKRVNVPPFDPIGMAEYMGFVERPPVVDNSKEMEELKAMLLQLGGALTRYAQTH